MESWIEKDFAKQFSTRISFCSGIILNKNNNGVDHTQINRLQTGFTSSENTHRKITSSKSTIKDSTTLYNKLKISYDDERLKKKLDYQASDPNVKGVARL